jgi:energy-converting hydrogenase Eha subunit F
LVNDEMLTSLREEADHSMEHQLGFVGAQDQNDVAWVQVFGDRLDPHPSPRFDRGGHAPADDVDRDRVPLIEDQTDSLWMQVHERLVYGTGALSPVAGRWQKSPLHFLTERVSANSR